MILYHPLDESNEFIQKYKLRKVKIEHGLKNLWFGSNQLVSSKKEAVEMTFEKALEITRFYKKSSLIKFHFSSEIEEAKIDIKEFDIEDFYNSHVIVFEKLKDGYRN